MEDSNLKSLFPLKYKDLHPTYKIYKGICSCKPTYVGKTKRNVDVRFLKRSHPSVKSEPSKHLNQMFMSEHKQMFTR